ncbi:hypothetical protein BJ546DRAFT_826458, partial [Cryomyces antarcticus]
QSFINTSGEVVLHRRKIKPTLVERSIWDDKQADSLTCVVDYTVWESGPWEHLQPLLRYSDYSQGANIHIAGWSPFWEKPQGILWPHHIPAEAEKMACQFMAMEGAAFVLVCTQVLTEAN